jgi:hypothetical protein
VDESRAPLGYNAGSSGKLLPTFRDNLPFSSSMAKKIRTGSNMVYVKEGYILEDPADCLVLEDKTDRLSRNVDNILPIYAVQNPTTAKISNANVFHRKIIGQHRMPKIS